MFSLSGVYSMFSLFGVYSMFSLSGVYSMPRGYLTEWHLPDSTLCIKDAEHLGSWHVSDHLFYSFHGVMWSEEGFVEVYRVNTQSHGTIFLACSHRRHPLSGLLNWLNDS